MNELQKEIDNLKKFSGHYQMVMDICTKDVPLIGKKLDLQEVSCATWDVSTVLESLNQKEIPNLSKPDVPTSKRRKIGEEETQIATNITE